MQWTNYQNSGEPAASGRFDVHEAEKSFFSLDIKKMLELKRVFTAPLIVRDNFQNGITAGKVSGESGQRAEHVFPYSWVISKTKLSQYLSNTNSRD